MSCPQKRVLIISGIVPAIGRGGGCMALHRHFVERKDYEIAVAGVSTLGVTSKMAVDLFPHPILERLQRTRFSRFFLNFIILSSWLWLPRKLSKFIASFRPDIIFTVPDNLHLGWAWGASRKFRIPLAVNFQDLFPISRFVPKNAQPYQWVSKFLINKFREVAQKSEAVFYTSDGMQAWFDQKNGSILYPLGAKLQVCEPDFSGEAMQRKLLVYAGNCYGAYGRMLLNLAKEIENSPEGLQLRIYPAGNDWSKNEQEHFQATGVLQSFKTFEELKKELEKASAFLTVMSFETAEKNFVETSFTTKWLDYAPYSKPVFVWAPEYSSAAIFASRYRCAEVIIDSTPAHAIHKMGALFKSRDKYQELSESSKNLAQTVLNPDRIHEILVQKMDETLSRRSYSHFNA